MLSVINPSQIGGADIEMVGPFGGKDHVRVQDSRGHSHNSRSINQQAYSSIHKTNLIDAVTDVSLQGGPGHGREVRREEAAQHRGRQG